MHQNLVEYTAMAAILDLITLIPPEPPEMAAILMVFIKLEYGVL